MGLLWLCRHTPPRWRRHWGKYRPSGRLAIPTTVGWHPEAATSGNTQGRCHSVFSNSLCGQINLRFVAQTGVEMMKKIKTSRPCDLRRAPPQVRPLGRAVSPQDFPCRRNDGSACCAPREQTAHIVCMRSCPRPGCRRPRSPKDLHTLVRLAATGRLASIDPAPGPEYILAEFTSGGSAPKSISLYLQLI